jgi:hypothetical protein
MTQSGIYVFRPKGHGSLTFAIFAENADLAKGLVSVHINENHRHGHGALKYEADGWDDNGYEIEYYAPRIVMEHPND